MAFVSQLKESKTSTRRGSKASIVMTQSYKPSTNSEEMSVRISSNLMKRAGIEVNSKVDMLHDQDNNKWMIKKCDIDGFNVSGKDSAPTALIRYTLKDGHVKLTKNRSELPTKKECEESSISISDEGVVFTLADNNERD
ncbi:hypothetical protein [Photobacterium sanguinicancri]|uniref:hypothetical protein n=1 Tax=Photobacterium sanguinicancri TaxID=875932 RepID=UPI0026E1C68C|nr:hypothetical protein [Photobacterium sanguinicancri]MDO6501182.1 hypothetical protein [Photobacterium sanguinicancri]